MVEIKRKKKYKLWESIIFAFRGIGKAIKKERNLKIHLGAGFLAVLLGFLLKISVWEWLVMVMVIASVIAMEIFNAAVEAVCDLMRFKLNLTYYETYWVRNFSAGGVMVLAIAALIIGGIIFGPKLILVFGG
jgi:diacylglycerol kinase